jgi:flagellin-like hook-associated protein FlgL
VVARLSNQATSQDAVQGNINNANNIIDITQTGLSSISSILAQMQGLATQVSNGLFNSVDQTNLFTQFASLNRQIGQIAATTSLNGNNLLTGNQTLSVVSGTDGVNNQTTLIQGIDITRLQTALNAISFAVASQNLTPTTLVDGVPTVSNPTSAQQTISFNGLANGDSATIGGLTFTANRDLTAAQVATIFAQKVNTPSGTSAYGTFTNSFAGSFTASDNGSGTVIFAGSITGPQSIAVSGNIASATTPITSSSITSNISGVNYVAPTNAQQTISFNGLTRGDSASVGGLTFTANSDLTASQVASIFYQKIANSSNSAAGSFTNNFQGGYNLASPGSSNAVTFTATATGPNSISISGNIASTTTAITSANMASTRTGVTYVAPSYAQQTIGLNAMAPGDTATLGGLRFTANTGLTAAEVAAFFVQKINSPSSSPTGGFFNNSFIGGFSAVDNSNGTVTLNGNAVGPMSAIVVSSTLSSTIRPALSASDITIVAPGGPSSAAQFSVVLHSLAAGETATVGGLTFTASSNVTATQVADIFAAKINSNTNSSSGTFLNAFSGGFTATSSGMGNLSLNGTSFGARTMEVSGRTVSATITQSSDVSISVTGNYSSSGNYAQQLIQMRALSAGETETLGGLTLTANSSMTARDVAIAFLNKQQYNSDPPSSAGSFSGTSFTYGSQFSLNNYNVTLGQLSANASSPGPRDLLPASGTVFGGSGNTALSASDVTTISVGTDSQAGAYAQQTVQFHDLFPGESVTVGGLAFYANTFVNAATVANNFSARMSSNTSSPTGGYFSGSFSAYFTPGSISSGALSITGSYYGPQGAISASGSSSTIPSNNAYLSSSNVTTVVTGFAGTAGVYAQQTVSLNALNTGDVATIGGLTFTAAKDLTATEVAQMFADKTAASSPHDPLNGEGSFTGSLTGFNGTSSSNALTLTGTSFGPMSTVSVSGSVTPRVALTSSNVTTQAAGSNGVLGVRAIQTVTLYDLNAGDSATIDGLTLTTNTNLTSSEVASLFASKITAGREPGSNLGAFSGTFVGGFTGVSTGRTLTLTGTSYGPMATVTASQMVSGAANAPSAITLINQFISQISSTQASLSAASTNLNSALDKSTKLVTSSQKTVDDIQNIDLTALQASLQALSTQQSLDFQVISQMNNAASSLLAIFR